VNPGYWSCALGRLPGVGVVPLRNQVLTPWRGAEKKGWVKAVDRLVAASGELLTGRRQKGPPSGRGGGRERLVTRGTCRRSSTVWGPRLLVGGYSDQRGGVKISLEKRDRKRSRSRRVCRSLVWKKLEAARMKEAPGKSGERRNTQVRKDLGYKKKVRM